MSKKNVDLTTINLFGKHEIDCALHTRSLKVQDVKALCEAELLRAYASLDDILNDINMIEVLTDDAHGAIIYFHTKKTDKVRYLGEGGYLYRFKSGINPDVIKRCFEIDENKKLIKSTCHELGMTQKELAEYIGVAEDTLGKWVRGVTDMPKMAIKLFELLIIEKKFNALKRIFADELKD